VEHLTVSQRGFILTLLAHFRLAGKRFLAKQTHFHIMQYKVLFTLVKFFCENVRDSDSYSLTYI